MSIEFPILFLSDVLFCMLIAAGAILALSFLKIYAESSQFLAEEPLIRAREMAEDHTFNGESGYRWTGMNFKPDSPQLHSRIVNAKAEGYKVETRSVHGDKMIAVFLKKGERS